MGSLTFFGMQAALLGTNVVAGSAIANIAQSLRLYTSASSPSKLAGTGSYAGSVYFTEVANGNGYATGGVIINSNSWTFSNDGTNGLLTLANQTWTASGGSIVNIAGAYIADGSGNVLGWFERTAGTVTIASGDQLVASSLIVQLT